MSKRACTRVRISNASVLTEKLELRRLLSAGQFDSGFGDSGTAFAELVPGGSCNAGAVAGDGKILLVGGSSVSGGPSRDAVVRLNVDGTPDLSFGTRGVFTGLVEHGELEAITAVAVQRNGGIIVAGHAVAPNGDSVQFVGRIRSNGELETTFGSGGVAIIPKMDSPTSLAILPSGAILVGGEALEVTASGLQVQFAVVRLRSDGNLDAGFGSGGVTITNTGRPVQSLAIEGNGQFVAAGGGVVVRYNANGSLDNSFGGKGVANTGLAATGLALRSDGRILLGLDGGEVAQLMKDGTLDSSFGNGGIANFTKAPANTVLLSASVIAEPDGRVVAVCDAGATGDSGADDTVIARFTSNGKIDNTFGIGGSAATPYQGGIAGVALAAEIDSQGRIIVPFGGFIVRRFAPGGSLDPTFGYFGQEMNPFGISGAINAVTVEPDGKILVAGSEASPAPGLPTDAAVARYNADGSLDTTFGTRGLELVQIGSNAAFTSIKTARNSDIILGGYGQSGSTDAFAVVRLYYNGYRNHSFGSGGIELTSFGSANGQRCTSIALQANGDIIAGGSTFDAGGNPQQMAVARYLPSGALDPSFGVAGQATFKPGGEASRANSMVLQRDGRIVLAGSIGTQFGLIRLRNNGTLDSTFGSGGATITKFADSFGPMTSFIETAAQDASGNIVAVGEIDFSDSPTALARYLPSGKPDPGFGSGGNFEIGSLLPAPALTLQSDGKIVLGGNDGGSTAVARFTSGGKIDAAFGASGTALLSPLVTSPSEPDFPTVTALAIQPDGKILVAAGSDLFGLLGK
jgi:uncharacterized delta-60 repeat protein